MYALPVPDSALTATLMDLLSSPKDVFNSAGAPVDESLSTVILLPKNPSFPAVTSTARIILCEKSYPDCPGTVKVTASPTPNTEDCPSGKSIRVGLPVVIPAILEEPTGPILICSGSPAPT